MLPWYLEFRPESFHDLLTPSQTNVRLLTWLLAWNPLVFPGRKLPESIRRARAQTAGSSRTEYVPLGARCTEHERPAPPILVLTGPTGCGKTTLARTAAAQAGYQTLEIDLAGTTEQACATALDSFLSRSWGGAGLAKDRRPPCLLLDWYVEAPALSSRLLGLARAVAERGRGLTRPVLICTDDFYAHASLRALRPFAACLDCAQQGQELVMHMGQLAGWVAATKDLRIDAAVVGALIRQCGCDLRAALALLEAGATDARHVTLEGLARLHRASSGASIGLLAHAALLGRIPPDGVLSVDADFSAERAVFNAPRVNARQLRGFCGGAVDVPALLTHLWELGPDLLPVTRSEAATCAEVADLGSELDVLAVSHVDDAALSFAPLHYFAMLGSRTAAVPSQPHRFALPALPTRLARDRREAQTVLAQVAAAAPRRMVSETRTAVLCDLPFLDVIAHPRSSALATPPALVLRAVGPALADWGMHFTSESGRIRLSPPFPALIGFPLSGANVGAFARQPLSVADLTIMQQLTESPAELEKITTQTEKEEVQTQRPNCSPGHLYRPASPSVAAVDVPLLSCVFNRGVTKAVRRAAPIEMFMA